MPLGRISRQSKVDIPALSSPLPTDPAFYSWRCLLLQCRTPGSPFNVSPAENAAPLRQTLFRGGARTGGARSPVVLLALFRT